MGNIQDEVMTRKEAAAYLKICKTTLDRQKIPCYKLGRCTRFKKSNLDLWLETKLKAANNE